MFFFFFFFYFFFFFFYFFFFFFSFSRVSPSCSPSPFSPSRLSPSLLILLLKFAVRKNTIYNRIKKKKILCCRAHRDRFLFLRLRLRDWRLRRRYCTSSMLASATRMPGTYPYRPSCVKVRGIVILK